MTRDICATCQSRIKTNSKFVCCICNKRLHLTVECIEFDEYCIDVLVKFKNNLIHVCNNCIPKKQDFSDKLESKNESLNEKKTNFNLKKSNDELKKTRANIKSEKNEKSNNVMTNLQTKLKTVKKDSKTLKQSLGSVKPGKSVPVHEKFVLGICSRGIPKTIVETASADDTLHAEIAEVDTKIVKAQRLGKYDRNKTLQRTLLINTQNLISRDLILRAAIRLNVYNRYMKTVYISPEINNMDAKK